MACYHPVQGWKTSNGVVFSEAACRGDDLGRIEIPCGRCLGCRLRRAQEWAVRIMHEAQLHEHACFVTLTYGRDKLPPGGSLCYADVQLFWRRLRRWQRFHPRYFISGEYGPLNLRPHYHACLFGTFFPDQVSAGKSGAGAVFFDSPILRDLWGHGSVSVQPLTPQTAAYCARYIVDKLTGDPEVMSPELRARWKERYEYVDLEGGEIRQKVPEFSRCSLKPGIGARWFARHRGDVFSTDSVILDGKEVSVPKYYDKLARRAKAIQMDFAELERVERAKRGAADQTPERLAVREVVHQARVRNQRRDL